MIRGMTGHGRGQRSGEGVRATIDARSVNHRFLDCEVRGAVPPDLEAEIRARVEKRLFRGRVEVHVALDVTGGEAVPLRVNQGAMLALVHALREVARESGVSEELKLEHIAALPWARLVETGMPELTPVQQGVVLDAVDDAVAGVVAMREREGRDIAADMRQRLQAVRSGLDVVRAGAEGAAAAQLERLRARMAELLQGAAVDPGRLAQEAAILADRSDVSEEIVRLGAFLEQLDDVVGADGPSGKRLDFTLQEAFREVNTIGSKARAQAVSAAVIDMKSELERMREQAANVE